MNMRDGGPHARGFDAALLARVEEAGLNASAPPQQRLVGGWLLRLSPGKAKRARCANAIAASPQPLPAQLARVRAAYAAARLPCIVRITPFTQPPSLDTELAARDWHRFDDTRVMVIESLAAFAAAPMPAGLRVEAPGNGGYAEAIGRLRGSPLAQRQAHAERLAASPVPYRGLLLKDEQGAVVACAQMAIEDELVGLYDVFTDPAQRGRGHARRLCVALLAQASTAGAKAAYLQVEADNAAARHVYAGLGFRDAYAYHYRSPEAHVE